MRLLLVLKVQSFECNCKAAESFRTAKLHKMGCKQSSQLMSNEHGPRHGAAKLSSEAAWLNGGCRVAQLLRLSQSYFLELGYGIWTSAIKLSTQKSLMPGGLTSQLNILDLRLSQSDTDTRLLFGLHSCKAVNWSCKTARLLNRAAWLQGCKGFL